MEATCEHCGTDFELRLGRWGHPRKSKYCGQNCQTAAWKQRNPEKAKSYASRTPEGRRDSYLEKTYGITTEDWDEMIKKQKYRCAICGVHHSKVERTFVVDHDHETGQVRGLLCHSCNVMLGHAKDNVDTLLNAIQYLRSNNDE